MKFKELFDKEMLVESQHVRKGLKIFYEFDLKLIKPQVETPEAAPAQPAAPAPDPNMAAQSAAPAADPTQAAPVQEPVQQQPEQTQEPAQQEDPNAGKPDLSGLLASIQTEEEDHAAEESKEQVVRHFRGEYVCSEEQADNIQTFDDVIDTLASVKKDGTEILDDWSKEVVLLCANQKFDELKTQLDKKSKIFAEVYFGYKKDDSVGVRFRKGEGSDSLSSSILIDDQIVTLTKFGIDKVNQKIVEYRNYEAKKS